MRKILLVGLVSLTALAGCGEVKDSYYPTSKEAVSDGAIERGWIPGFLTSGAREIREAHDLDSNRVIIACEISAPELSALLERAQRIENMGDVAPPRWDRSWWPGALRDGNYGQLAKDGFSFYSIKDDRGTWFAAVNSKGERAYFWPSR